MQNLRSCGQGRPILRILRSEQVTAIQTYFFGLLLARRVCWQDDVLHFPSSISAGMTGEHGF
jgi:hypothetical protein